MSNPNCKDNLVPFKKGEDSRRNTAGRKPSRLKEYIKENNVSSQDIRLIMSNFLCKYSLQELSDKLKEGEKNLPIIVYGMINALISDLEKRRLNVIELALKYTVELPKQTIENIGDFGTAIITAFSKRNENTKQNENNSDNNSSEC